MIAEWLYWFTCQIGHNFNNAMGLEINEKSDLLTGLTMSWLFAVILLFVLVCVLILVKLDKKKEN